MVGDLVGRSSLVASLVVSVETVGVEPNVDSNEAKDVGPGDGKLID